MRAAASCACHWGWLQTGPAVLIGDQYEFGYRTHPGPSLKLKGKPLKVFVPRPKEFFCYDWPATDGDCGGRHVALCVYIKDGVCGFRCCAGRAYEFALESNHAPASRKDRSELRAFPLAGCGAFPSPGQQGEYIRFSKTLADLLDTDWGAINSEDEEEPAAGDAAAAEPDPGSDSDSDTDFGHPKRKRPRTKASKAAQAKRRKRIADAAVAVGAARFSSSLATRSQPRAAAALRRKMKRPAPAPDSDSDGERGPDEGEQVEFIDADLEFTEEPAGPGIDLLLGEAEHSVLDHQVNSDGEDIAGRATL